MLIIKIGGGASINIQGIVHDLQQINEPFIIIHGANAIRDQLAKDLKVSKKILTSISGYSSVYSDEEAIDLIMMAYAGIANKKLVESCQKEGINAVGLTGLDGHLIRGKRNLGIKIFENNKKKIVRDYSGKPDSINEEFLNLLLTNGYIPVITIPILDENNIAINSENDDIVLKFQEVIKAEKILFLIEAPGLLRHSDDPATLISSLTKSKLEELENTSDGRIKRKYHALTQISQLGNCTIIVADGRVDHPIQDAIAHKGTVITK